MPEIVLVVLGFQVPKLPLHTVIVIYHIMNCLKGNFEKSNKPSCIES